MKTYRSLLICLAVLLTACKPKVPIESSRPSSLPDASATVVRPWVEEQVSFRFNGDELIGLLTKPIGEDPFPAIVLVSGSGSEETGERSGVSSRYFIDHARTLVLSGFAVLRYDPPGVGKSSGAAGFVSLGNRMDEVMAAVRYLQSRPDIQADAIGLHGNSQGSWVIARAAAYYPEEVAFIISVSGAAIPVSEQQIFSIQTQSAAAGLSQQDIDKAVLMGRLLLDWQLIHPVYQEVNTAEVGALGDGPWVDFMQLVYQPEEMAPSENLQAGIEILESIQDEPWATFLYLKPLYLPALRSLTPDQLGPMKASAENSFLEDPQEYITRVRCPVLAFFGEDDLLQPTARSAALYEQYLTAGGNSDFMIVIIPDVGHAFTLSNSIYQDTLEAWLRSLQF
jgi:pimeloyl-ACP methyl ester carboxylesterase